MKYCEQQKFFLPHSWRKYILTLTISLIEKDPFSLYLFLKDQIVLDFLFLCVCFYLVLKLINLFSLEDAYFTILWWFLPYIDMNQPQVYMCPPSENEISIPLL